MKDTKDLQNVLRIVAGRVEKKIKHLRFSIKYYESFNIV